ncbi:MAG: hypothetical protein IJ339_02355 [Oscillospiraceae bacterium]|nr:hypothetical protein [Oscillospiraceae bacterium]MBQ7816185.1 hypothetical protein [Oscillospiraceae bacterium]
MPAQKGLSNDKLKIIAAAAMAVDHVGAYLFPHIAMLRIIGRVAFPIFAFMVAEGCRYTRNRKKYLLNMFVLALICQLLFFPFKPLNYVRIPVTFTLAIIIVYALDNTVKTFNRDCKTRQKAVSGFVLLAAVAAVWLLDKILVIDYGFYGCITPAIIYTVCCNEDGKNINILNMQLIMLASALMLVYINYGGLQIYSFLAIPLISEYNGKRENLVPKYFFYIFYPLHLAIIYAVQMIIY